MVQKPQISVLDLARYGYSSEPYQKFCEWQDCNKEGKHRAPRSRHDMNSYRWFCRDHAREFNKCWNYFSGMSNDEIEADRRADTVWRRPSWPLGDRLPTSEQARAFWQEGFSDPFSVFGEQSKGHQTKGGSNEVVLDGELERALDIFGMESPVVVEDVKARYKALVKRHHPDASSSTADEERIKDVNHAYQVILGFLTP